MSETVTQQSLFITPKERATPKETSCKATKAIIEYIRRETGEQDEFVEYLLSDFPYPSPEAPYTKEFLLDNNNWIELEASDELFERARILLGDEESTYKIALATPHFKNIFGVTETLARVVGPEIAMGRTPRLQRALQRTSHLEQKKITSSQAEIKITYHEPYRYSLKRDSCDFARGILSAVPQFAGAEKPAKLRESHCTIPIYRRGVIDGYFYVKDDEDHIWQMEWPYQVEDGDQIRLPAQWTQYLGNGKFRFQTRGGKTTDITGKDIGTLDDGNKFEWDGVLYGADSCVYHLEWEPQSRLSHLINTLGNLYTGRFNRQEQDPQQQQLDEMVSVLSSLSLAVVFNHIVNHLVNDRRYRCRIAILAEFEKTTDSLIVRAMALNSSESGIHRFTRKNIEVIGKYISFEEHQENLAVQTILNNKQYRVVEVNDIDQLLTPLVDEDIRQEFKRRLNYLVTVPLRHQQYLVGNLVLILSEKRRITDEYLDFLTYSARQMALEIWNVTKYERRVEELESLQRIDKTISSATNIEDILEGILNTALGLTDGKCGYILKTDKKIGRVAVRSGRELPSGAIGSRMTVALNDQYQQIGQFEIQSDEENAFDNDDERLLETLAGQAVIAIKNAEDRERRISAEIMSIMGELSAKMLHRMRNHLGGARSDIEEVQEWHLKKIRSLYGCLSNYDEVSYHLDGIDARLNDVTYEVGQALELINNLRKPFTKKDDEPVNVSKCLEAVLMQLDLPNNVIKNAEVTATLPPVQATYDQLSDLFSVILTNAKAAISAGGDISIFCKLLPTEKVTLTITDTGIGMTEETMAKIFELGFSTKDSIDGRLGGWGFGLWWARNYLQKIEGDIDVDSTPGQGSQFTLVLPIWSEQDAER